MSDQDLEFEAGEVFASDKLVQAREALGLSAESIMRELRLTPRVVAALEAGDLVGMGQPVFARGYIRAYCKRVSIDAEPFVAQYDAMIGELAPKRSRVRELASGAPSAPASMSFSKRPSALPRIIAAVVKLMLVVALLGGAAYGVSKLNINLAGFSLSGLFGSSEPVETVDPNRLVIPGTSTPSATPVVEEVVTTASDAEPTAVADEPSVEAVIETAAQEPAQTAVPEVQTEVVSRIETPATAPEPAAEPAPAPESLPAPEVVQQPQQTTAQPAADGVARVSIEFRDVSWVNIKDAKGGALFNGLAEKGRTLELSGPTPINFVIGRADAVSTLTFNGTTVDLEPFTRKNVARLTLPR